ncbi:uncharacterized protein LOC131205400 [Anopheles bellator]|uniref:uncharacterized protein LOC131205400 n=1 Tax=Anopheles bellator TaxID=139047 RepID=UPI002649438D|nr:uncharacterized protein LOC131205400 [Anopheles bellator]
MGRTKQMTKQKRESVARKRMFAERVATASQFKVDKTKLKGRFKNSNTIQYKWNHHLQPGIVQQSPTGWVNQPRRTKRSVASTSATIVIDDSDEENESNEIQSPNAGQADPGVPLFYEDRNPGIRVKEIPLYSTRPNEGESSDLHTTANESVIVLDSTLESMCLSEKGVNETAAPRAATRAEERPTSSAKTPSSTQGPEVIDLSDDSDSEAHMPLPQSPGQKPLDCIPLGYDVGRHSKVPHTPPHKAKPTKAKVKQAKPKTVPVDQKTKKRMIVIDGNNVAYGHLNGKMFSVKGLHLCIKYFQKLGHEVLAVVPQYKLKKSQSTDQALLERLRDNGEVILAPSKSLPGQCSSTYDDRLILSVAEQFDGAIVSNDNFRDLLDASPAWRQIIATRVIGYTWVKDCFFLPDDPYGRQGPSLQAILNGGSAN